MKKSEKVMSVAFAVPFLMATVGCVILLMALAGCSTVAGVGQLMGGIGNDIHDMAEGTRAKMKERN